MLRKKHFLIFTFCLGPLFLLAGNPNNKRITRQDYISTWKDEAVHQMKKYGIPASITLAQGILESGDGNSRLARVGNNHFGIKCHDWTGKKIFEDDDAKGECFRHYKSAKESYEDHSLFLKNRSRYAFLFEYEVTDYKSWSKGLKKAGYATNPKYPELLIRIIEENDLARFDKEMDAVIASKPIKVSPNGKNEVEVTFGRQYLVSDNNIKFIEVKEGDTFEKLADAYGVAPWQVRKYNDLEKSHALQAGEKLYIQPKRNKHRKISTHVVQPGETLKIISQHYGVKLKKLVKKNKLEDPNKIKAGMTIRLR